MRWIMMALGLMIVNFAEAAEISFTVDDPEVLEGPLLQPQQRSKKILEAFQKHKIQGALFVCGMRVDNSEGKKLLKRWDTDGHIIANHSYSHLNFNKEEVTIEAYRKDF